MRYFSYNEPIQTIENGVAVIYGNEVVTKSEDDLREEYWPYWYGKMCTKFGKEKVDSNYSFEDCLHDWLVVNWAWEVTE